VRVTDPPRRQATSRLGPFSYTDEGEGPALVGVHGLPGSARDFRYLGGELPSGVRLVRLDLPGFGETPASSAAGVSIADRGNFVIAALEALSLEKVVLFGHSMGGPVATFAAAHAPQRIAALGLLASVGRRPHKLLRRFPAPSAFAGAMDKPVLGTLTKKLLHRAFVSTGFPPQTTEAEVAQTTRIIAALDLETHRQNLARVIQPTLVAWAEDDVFIEKEIFEDLAQHVPNGPRLSWPEGGHNIQKSHAKEVAAALAALIR
jgi:pimeloyl-ACP methyl ester carboxylesterase